MKLSIRNSIISFGVIIGTALVGAFVVQTMVVDLLDINGPVYRDVSINKDLIAEITPPSFMPIEAYALAYEAQFHSERKVEDVARIKAIEGEYRRAVEKWNTIDLPADEAAKLKNDVLPKVDAFWAAMNNDLIPILGHGYEELNPVLDKFVVAYRDQRDAVAALSKETKDLLNKNLEAATATTSFYINLGRFAGVAVVLAFAIGLLAIMRYVIGPMTSMTGYLTRLVDGDSSMDIPYRDRKDEIGSVAHAVHALKESQQGKVRMEAEMELNRVQAEKNRIADQKQAEADAAQRLQRATSGLAHGLKQLAAGNLDFQLTEAFSAEFEDLRNDFNLSVLQLNEALAAVYESVGNLSGGTGEISAGVNDLSKRTETQAASLEETVAAVGQITENVSISAKRAEVAQSVAVQANASATASGEVVSKAVDAMTRIEDSAKSIANIIGVIDEIAFQTNLLALNAGVEAARAGDAGRGFAVVAQEVRELAQRSAVAAKEIKGLITASTREVETGAKLVYETGKSLQVIGAQVNSINDHIHVITVAAREQSTALAEVNIAINHFDQNTQMNASMVEESSAAAESLLSECAQLEKLVLRFRLSGEESGRQFVHALRSKRQEMGHAADHQASGHHATAHPALTLPNRARRAAAAMPVEF